VLWEDAMDTEEVVSWWSFWHIYRFYLPRFLSEHHAMIRVTSIPFFTMPFGIARGDIKQVKIVMRVTIATMTSSMMNAATPMSNTHSSKKERMK
jgi:hypothetical protein